MNYTINITLATSTSYVYVQISLLFTRTLLVSQLPAQNYERIKAT